MRHTGLALIALLGSLLMVSGCRNGDQAPKYHPATVEETDQEGIKKVTLDARAAERIGLETAPIREEMMTLAGRSVTRRVVPYGALMYDTKGGAWTFTSPQPLLFVRQPVVVEKIEGDRVILSEGPPAGTIVVTVGAAELMGAEHGYGH
jgi:hypothetical protein